MSDSEDDLFEKTYGNLKIKEPSSSSEEQEQEPEPEPVKKERKKTVMTPERKKQLLENLKKGRETAKINRQKKAQVKKIKKHKEVLEIDETLLKHAKTSYDSHTKERNLMDEIEKLKNQLETQKEPNVKFIVEEKKEKKEKKEIHLQEEIEKQKPKKKSNVSFKNFWDED